MRSAFIGACVALTACSTANPPEGSGPGPSGVVNVTWEWVSTLTPVDRVTSADPSRYTLLLMDDGNVRLQIDCNRGGGSYQLASADLTFGPIAATRMACPADTQDAVFLRDLQRVTSFFVRDGDLFLELPLDSGTMRFRRAGSSDR